jgi:hypothetical protein
MILTRTTTPSAYALAFANDYQVPKSPVFFEADTDDGEAVVIVVGADGSAVGGISPDGAAYVKFSEHLSKGEHDAAFQYDASCPDEYEWPAGTFDPAAETIEQQTTRSFV